MKVLTICGSMRFSTQMKDIAFKLESENHFCVLQPVYCDGNALNAEQLKSLTEAHLKRIDISDGIYVANSGGYIGQAVSKEIEYARLHDKEILFHE